MESVFNVWTLDIHGSEQGGKNHDFKKQINKNWIFLNLNKIFHVNQIFKFFKVSFDFCYYKFI